jgi:Periplasmic protease
MVPSDAEKKLWTWQSALVDHIRIMVRIPTLLTAPAFLTASQMEAVQSSICEINSSNIGNAWHKHMKRISGIDNNHDNNTNVQDFLLYGKTFGISDGTGYNVDELSAVMKGKFSKFVIYAAEAVALQQMWMDLVGNTILAFLRGTLFGSPRKEQSRIFEVLFMAYYFIPYLFLLMESSLLAVLPSNCPTLYKIITETNYIITCIFVIPFGIAGVGMLPFYIISGGEAQPLPSRGSYVPVPEDASVGVTYAINLLKPSVDSKVGIRLGFNSIGQITITSIKPNSIASASDLRVGDIVIAVNGKKLKNIAPEEVTEYLLQSAGVLTINVAHTEDIDI